MNEHRTDNDLFNEIHTLAMAQLNGELDADKAQRLESLVTSDPYARRLYVQWVEQTVSLRWWAGHPGTAALPADPPIAKLIHTDPEDSVATPAPTTTTTSRRIFRLTPTRIAAAVAALLAIGVVAVMLLDNGAALDNAPLAANTSAADQPRGIVADAGDAVWEDASHDPNMMIAGAPLTAGPVRLKSGSAQLLLNGGAAVTLIGATEFEIVNDNRGRLTSGRILVRVPPRAVGFTIDAPNTTVVDLGTKFGVEVIEGDNVEVHVFEGKVNTTRLDAAGNPRQTISMTEGDAVRISRIEPPVSIASTPDRFLFTPDIARPPLVDRFEGDTLDANKWQVNLPFADSAIRQLDGRVELVNRGQLLTTKWFDVADGGVRVRFRWTPAEANNYDSIVVITRLQEMTLGREWGHLVDGVHFKYEPKTTDRKRLNISIPNTWEGGEQRHDEQHDGELIYRPNASFDVEVIDDGRNLTFRMTEVGNPTNTASATASVPPDVTPPTAGYIAILNRERYRGVSHTSVIEDFRIESLK